MFCENLEYVSKNQFLKQHNMQLNLSQKVFVNSNVKKIHLDHWLMVWVHCGFFLSFTVLKKFGEIFKLNNRTVQNKRTVDKFGP